MSLTASWTELFADVSLLVSGDQKLNMDEFRRCSGFHDIALQHFPNEPSGLMDSMSKIRPQFVNGTLLRNDIVSWLASHETAIIEPSTTLSKWALRQYPDMTWDQFCNKMKDPTVWPNVLHIYGLINILPTHLVLARIKDSTFRRTSMRPLDNEPVRTATMLFISPCIFSLPLRLSTPKRRLSRFQLKFLDVLTTVNYYQAQQSQPDPKRQAVSATTSGPSSTAAEQPRVSQIHQVNPAQFYPSTGTHQRIPASQPPSMHRPAANSQASSMQSVIPPLNQSSRAVAQTASIPPTSTPSDARINSSREPAQPPTIIPATPREKRPYQFHRDLKLVMYGFGDDQNPLDESVELINDLVVDFITETTQNAMAVGNSGKIKVDDVFFTLRRDPKKYNRAKELISMKRIIQTARKALGKED